jgi:hypothetical protein
MKRIFILTVVFFTAALLMTGCKKVVTCPPKYLVAPSQVSPANWSLVDTLTPLLSWTFPTVAYPYPSAGTTCIPETYRLHISTGPLFVDDLGYDVAGTINSSTVPSALQPGTEYSWGIQPMSFGEVGPYAGSRYFFTGPVCDAAALVVPTLLSPYNGGLVHDLAPSLIWDYSAECRPDYYTIELDSDPGFVSTTLNGSTGGNPSTRWGPGSSLSECTTYYWRVTPVVGGTSGPVSNTFSFKVNAGGGPCGGSGYPSRVAGKVWQEYCAIPDGPAPAVPPPGCILSGGVLTANGDADPGEPGIANVVVRLGDGSCPSTNRGLVITNSKGSYNFENLPPGTYCISVNVADNITPLVPGGFTHPDSAVSSDIGSYEVTLNNNWKAGFNFGWMYQFGPTTPYGEITGIVWDDVCKHTGEVYDPGKEPAGCVTDALDWYKVRGNGVKAATEKGIQGVYVGISQNSCDDPVFAWSDTDATGRYYFLVPANTNYCVHIKSDSTENAVPLKDGVWTQPFVHFDNKNDFDYVYVSDGALIDNINFGWDFMDGLSIQGPPLFEYPKFHIDLDSNCRVGPERRWQTLAVLKKGMEFNLEGLDPTHKWVLLTPSNLLNPGEFPDARFALISGQCWVMLENGTPPEDLSQIPIREVPDLPTYTPTVTQTPTPMPDPCNQYTTQLVCERYKAQCVWRSSKCRSR